MLYNNLWGPGNCIDQLKDCAARGINEICSIADNFCANHVENIYDIYLGRDEYDFRELVPDRFPYEFYVEYLNTPEVQAAIGTYVNFTEGSQSVGNAFSTTGDDGRSVNAIEDIRDLIAQDVSVVMYAGDADYICNWLGGQEVASMVDAPGYGSAGYVNITTDDNVVHGQVRQAGKFAFVRIYESGHEVPFYQPVVALSMFERVINGHDVATGKVKVNSKYRTVGPAESTYREGNSTVQWEVLDPSATYNTTTNRPNPVAQSMRRSAHQNARRFKP